MISSPRGSRPIFRRAKKRQVRPKPCFWSIRRSVRRPEKFNVWLDVLEAVLTNNRDSLQRFAVLFFNIESHWWKEEYTANTPENVEALLAYCHSLSLEGATDLEQALAEAARPGGWMTDKETTLVGSVSAERRGGYLG